MGRRNALHENDRQSAVTVYPSTGIRHGITIGNSHTWCGRDTDGWLLEMLRKFDPNELGCVRCQAVWKRDSYALSATPEYKAWQSMKTRCGSMRPHIFKYYGAKGIVIFEGWIDNAKAFIDHIGPRPSPLHSVDRISNEDGYVPGNVRWATDVEQMRNRGCAKLIDIDYVIIYHWIKKGFKATDVATAFGVTRRFISRVKKRLLASSGATGVT